MALVSRLLLLLAACVQCLLAEESIVNGTVRSLWGRNTRFTRKLLSGESCDVGKTCSGKKSKVLKTSWIYGDYDIIWDRTLWTVDMKEDKKLLMDFFLVDEGEYKKFKKSSSFKTEAGFGCMKCNLFKTHRMLTIKEEGKYYYVMSAKKADGERSVTFTLTVSKSKNASKLISDEEEMKDQWIIYRTWFIFICICALCAGGCIWMKFFQKAPDDEEDEKDGKTAPEEDKK